MPRTLANGGLGVPAVGGRDARATYCFGNDGTGSPEACGASACGNDGAGDSGTVGQAFLQRVAQASRLSSPRSGEAFTRRAFVHAMLRPSGPMTGRAPVPPILSCRTLTGKRGTRLHPHYTRAVNPPAPSDQTAAEDRAAGRSLGPVLGWACYLGSSWTWIIGMVLPVLLIRDHGWRGWVVFAVPNVIGAAAMGWVLRSGETSRRLVERHRAACVLFSGVTLAFHVFVVGWAFAWVFGPAGPALALIAAGVVLALVRGGAHPSLWTAVAVSAVSIVAMVIGFGLPDAGLGVRDGLGHAVLPTPPPLLFLPVAILGFALCPYLDLTFHRARRALPTHPARAAFTLGFGVVFLVYIAFALLYAGVFKRALLDQNPTPLPTAWFVVLLVHMAVQAGFTIGLHAHEAIERRGRLMPLVLAAAVLIGAALAVPAYLDAGEHVLGPSIGELLYRLFLLPYGLVFPAYVWLCVIPTVRPVPLRPRRIVFALATLVALPWAFHFVTYAASGVYAWPFTKGAVLVPVFAILGLARLVVELWPVTRTPSIEVPRR